MKPKLLSIALCLCYFFSLNLQAQEKIKTIKSKLDEATVFLHGAELSHTAVVTLLKGENEFKIDGLSPNIDINSLKIKSGNVLLCHLLSFQLMTFHLKCRMKVK